MPRRGRLSRTFNSPMVCATKSMEPCRAATERSHLIAKVVSNEFPSAKAAVLYQALQRRPDWLPVREGLDLLQEAGRSPSDNAFQMKGGHCCRFCC